MLEMLETEWVFNLHFVFCFCKIKLIHQHQPIFFGLIWPFLSVARELSVGCCYGSNWRIVIILCTHFLGKLAALLWAHVQLCCCHAVMRGHVTCHAASRAIELPCLARTSPHPSSCSSLVTHSSLPPDLRLLCRVQIAAPLLFGIAIKHILSAPYSL